jgi:hypothetical protein
VREEAPVATVKTAASEMSGTAKLTTRGRYQPGRWKTNSEQTLRTAEKFSVNPI